jgi:hypothetical protein
MVTLEEIKERYPEGCEVECVITGGDYAIVKHSMIIEDAGDFYIYNGGIKEEVFLYVTFGDKFAEITKPAPYKYVEKPKRYKDKEVDGMDVIALAKFWSLNFNEASILKYLLRDKDQDIEDMWKIVDFAQREHEYLTNKNK